jgi:predicted porin
MLSRFLLLLAVLGLTSATAFGADEVKTEAKKEEVKTWKDNLSLSYHGEFGFMRDNSGEGDLKDFFQFHNPTVGYKLMKNLSFSSSWEFRYADHTRAKFVNRFYRALFSLSMTNVLTEKEDGIKLDLGVARRYMDRTAVPGTYGNNRYNFTLTKSWGDNNASLFVQYLENDPKTLSGTNAATDSTWRRTIEFIPTVNLQLTDKLSFTSTDDINITSPWFGGHADDSTLTHEWSFAVFTYKFTDIVSSYLQLKYNHITDFSAQTDKAGVDSADNFEYYLGTSYSVTPKVTLTAEVGSEFLTNQDEKTISNKLKKPEFVLYVDASF